MADVDAVARMARVLREHYNGGTLDWNALAEAAVAEAARTITIVQGPLPANPLLVLVKSEHGGPLKVLAQVGTLADAVSAATAYLTHEGEGEVYGAEIKRVLTVA